MRRPRNPYSILLAVGLLMCLGTLPVSATSRGGGELAVSDYIVVYRAGRPVDGVQLTQALERERGFRATRKFRLVNGFAARLSAAQVAGLRADPRVAAVEPDRAVRAIGSFPLTSGESVPVGTIRIGAATTDSAHDPSGANVAVIDTGIDLGSPDLNAVNGTNCVGSGPANDDHGHGTHIAGTIGARNNGSGTVGVAPGTRLYAVKVLDSRGQGSWSSVICGIEWVVATRTDADPTNDIAVINLSLGGPGAPVKTCAAATDPLHKAICAATAAGVHVVAAAGNSGWDFDFAAEPDLPAAYPEVLTVTAMSDTDGLAGALSSNPNCSTGLGGDADDRYASYSNYATTAAGIAHTIAAPGTCIRSTWIGGTYKTISGTSMAAPHVTAAVALCLDDAGAAGPCAGLSPSSLIAKMRADAEAKTTTDSGYGFNGDPARPAGGRYYGYLLNVPQPDGPTEPPAVTVAPTLTTTSPPAGATGRPLNTTVNVTFDQPVNRVVAQAAFSLSRPNGTTVSGTFSWADDSKLTFRPSLALPEGTTFKATVGPTTRNLDGTPIAAPVEWTFRTLASGSKAPIGVTVQNRSVRAGGYARLATNNAAFFDVNSTLRKTFTTSWYARFSSVPRDALSFNIAYAGKNTRACTQVVQVYNWVSATWVQLDSRSVGKTKVLINLSAPGTQANYVSGKNATGELRVRVRCTTNVGTFYARADYMKLSFTRP
ncbi:hypothetical protein BH23CHL7_BH23CHL7_01520 [soil metagenome]